MSDAKTVSPQNPDANPADEKQEPVEVKNWVEYFKHENMAKILGKNWKYLTPIIFINYLV